MVVQHHPQSRQQSRVVLQRLTHAHHHHIGNHTLALLQVFAQKVLRKPQLPHNFSGGQVAAKALVASAESLKSMLDPEEDGRYALLVAEFIVLNARVLEALTRPEIADDDDGGEA